jgi:hypothetical protein
LRLPLFLPFCLHFFLAADADFFPLPFFLHFLPFFLALPFPLLAAFWLIGAGAGLALLVVVLVVALWVSYRVVSSSDVED